MQNPPVHVAAIVLAVVATDSFAQETLGELLDAGGTKVQKQHLVTAMADSNIKGLTSSGKAEMNIDLKSDGTLSGYVVARANGASSGSIGKWWVEDNGKVCVDEHLTAWNMRHNECWFTYLLGDTTYRTVSDSEDREAKIVKSTAIRKPIQ